MIIKPRWYQTPLINDTYKAWNDGYRNVGLIAPCGSGKTYTMGFICREFNNRNQYVVVIAHRNVLLSQISLSFASLGIKHDLICNPSTRRFIGDLHTEELGQCFLSETAKVCIASIGKLNNTNTTSWESKVGLWMMDETHHLLKENQWGRGVAKFTNAYGLGVTATFCRLDKKGLGSIADGVFDTIVQGVTAYDLIQSGDLSKYRVVRTELSKEVHRDMSSINQSSGSEYNQQKTKKILARKNIVGDVVGTYIKHASGLRGITFCQDIDACVKQAAAYNERGVPAIALSANTPDKERWQGIKNFKSGKILQLVNCNLFGEGFDVPACFCASFVNPTKSYGKFTQEFFRPLRKLEGKEYAWIFDHVGNIAEHGLPDHGLVWEDYLDRPPKGVRRGRNENALKLTTCTNEECQSDYELPASCCPWCGELYAVAGRGALKVVDGELVEMTDAEMKELRSQAKYILKDIRSIVERNHTELVVRNSILKNHEKQQAVHKELRKSIDAWSFRAWEMGLTIEQARAQFALLVECDVLTAMTLSKKDAEKLIERIAL